MNEDQAVNNLLSEATFAPEALARIANTAHALVIETRKRRQKQKGLDAFLREYDLSTEEGIALMCLAEALLRIPDKTTIDQLISDKISTAEWSDHLNKSGSLFVNAATWSLMLTGKIYTPTTKNKKNLLTSLQRLITRTGGSVIRPIILQGMKIIGKQFVMGTTIQKALTRAEKFEAKGYRYSYDMLGEAARTAQDADIYFKAYQNAIIAIGTASKLGPIRGPGISIKLSALHPRYELAHYERVMNELVPRLLSLAKLAKQYNIGLTVDAEEADRLDLSLDVIEAVFSHSSLDGWEGFGLAVQSYQKRAPFVIDWLADLSRKYKRKWMVRLIKGAYWDAEIKLSQMLGLEGYPVFTRKNSTDVSFIACAKKLFSYADCFYPQFGTHNAYSVAVILELAQGRKDFEFQCLHGMGAPLYDQIVKQGIPCRIYAPVGSHKELLGYLVRRLLENGANSSFINRIADENIPVEKIIADPVARIASLEQKQHPRIPLPYDLYEPERKNSHGLDLSNLVLLHKLKETMEETEKHMFESGPIISGKFIKDAPSLSVTSPSNTLITVGHVHMATVADVENALTQATLATKAWANTSVEERAACLDRAAELFEQHKPALLTLLMSEAGKSLADGNSEVRETIDFCRYYAARAREDLVTQTLPGPTGELNQLSLHPRGVITCISPWNFPLAIFSGQVLAALATGNVVIAKPAEQTPLIAAVAVRILHAAGIPANALHLLPGAGEVVGAKLVADTRVNGVMFTGSTEVAKLINQTLANREGPIVPLVAETGGQNAMIVDSSALPEQVVADVISSSFNSAGQRCSALRVLFLQEDIAPRVLTMLQGAMAELKIGDPALLETDVGPVIDEEALKGLQQHVVDMNQKAKLIFQAQLVDSLPGHYFAPCVFELSSLKLLKREVFGPILHVIRYSANELDQVLQQIIDTGYGLTLGIHTRIEATVNYIQERMPVGNVYVNRNMIGAVVGVQPFGGEGLSGTGPKAGGPHYLQRLCVERAVSINTTAAGGNASLVSLTEDDKM
jgi:RHH-type proline utilization regulon transcriptional repressor/proline dehydrogenase/delta 1-pyrroline-5-carboxylate dehydrogenase